MAEQASQAQGQGAATQVAAPVPGTPEYDQAMIAKYDAHQAGTGATPPADQVPTPAADAAKPPKPEAVPDKFWNAEKGEVDYTAWAKSTAELEKSLTQGKQQTPPAGSQTPPADTAAAQAVVEQAGLDFNALTSEFTEKGELSADSLSKLEKAGITKDVVDQYVQGQQALAAQRDAKGLEVVGGKENFTRMAEWAKTNMTHEELTAFNKGVAGSEAEMVQAMSALQVRYTAANGSEPKLLGGQGGDTPAAGYRSRAEMTTAMKDPRYNADPAYRQDVINKIAVTTAF